jgi:hypothetical protein
MCPDPNGSWPDDGASSPYPAQGPLHVVLLRRGGLMSVLDLVGSRELLLADEARFVAAQLPQ